MVKENEEIEEIKSNNDFKKRDKEYIRYVSEINGWSFSRAKQEMDRFKRKNVPYRYYVKKRLWSRNGKKLERSMRNIEREHRYDRYSLHKHAGLVAEAAGISLRKAKNMILESNLYTECSPRDYYEFRFWEKTLKEQKTYYTKGTVERLIMKYNTNPKEVEMIRNKIKFAETFGDLFGRIWFTNRELTFEAFLEKTKNLSVIFCKPIFGTHGAGIECISLPEKEEEKGKSTTD